MIDIESKGLNLVKDNVNDIRGLLDNEEALRDFFKTRTYIDNWDFNSRIKTYYDIVDLVFKNGNINEFYSALGNVDVLEKKTIDSDIKIFCAALLDFRDFLKSVYELYLLDQLYYILINIPLGELINIKNMSSGFKTGSYYESVNFEFGFSQVSLLNNEFIQYDSDLFYKKEEYRKRIETILSTSVYQDKRQKLMEILVNDDDVSFYFTKIAFLAESFRLKKKVSRRVLEKKPENQFSLY
ncbi:MAG: hypothetical protein NC483_04130 [Ruminococcus sp.]|nr:hypothetical protein [Ruminococcus sp.]